MEWHVHHDAGLSFAENRAELKLRHPGHDALIDAFGDRYDEMIAGAIDGTVALLERLAAAGVPLYAITNYPAQPFPRAQQRFPFMALFRDIAVSGYERIMKPDAELLQDPVPAQQSRARGHDLHRRTRSRTSTRRVRSGCTRSISVRPVSSSRKCCSWVCCGPALDPPRTRRARIGPRFDQLTRHFCDAFSTGSSMRWLPAARRLQSGHRGGNARTA